MQILKNLYQVSGDLNGITWAGVDGGFDDANSYILKTSDGLIMFDCGCGDTMDQIFRNIGYWGLDPNEIKYCLLTHPHLDHAGGAYLLQQHSAKIISSKETAEAVSAADERCAGYLYHKKFYLFHLSYLSKEILIPCFPLCLLFLYTLSCLQMNLPV
jgi:glyoxylase-like metal-dependent hydrolase (beta-lactamase superfamily II)